MQSTTKRVLRDFVYWKILFRKSKIVMSSLTILKLQNIKNKLRQFKLKRTEQYTFLDVLYVSRYRMFIEYIYDMF